MTFDRLPLSPRNGNTNAGRNSSVTERADQVREVVPGLGQVEWTLNERLAHAETLRLVHGPNRALAGPRRGPRFRLLGKGNCKSCGETWICSYAVWSAAVRAVAAMHQQARNQPSR